MIRVATIAVLCSLTLGAPAIAAHGPVLRCRVKVPEDYRPTPSNLPPNGQPESTRYAVAYEAYWWNCVAVRANDLDGRCPFVASGTPGASAGAVDGAKDADTQIDEQLKKYPKQAVRTYLQSLARQATTKAKMRLYFDRPTPEVAN
jgi:hypothetical protein